MTRAHAIEMPELDGTRALPALRAVAPDVTVVIYSVLLDPLTVTS